MYQTNNFKFSEFPEKYLDFGCVETTKYKMCTKTYMRCSNLQAGWQTSELIITLSQTNLEDNQRWKRTNKDCIDSMTVIHLQYCDYLSSDSSFSTAVRTF